jgi:LPXTG-site transpeptidase (sortase) family protein
MVSRMKKILPIIIGAAFIGVGALLLISIIRSQATSVTDQVQANQYSSQLKAKPNIIEGQPSQLIIPSLGMNLPIIPGYYDKQTKTWTLTLSEVQYATVTPPPNNQSGNTFLYGHYRPEVFARLHTIGANAQAIVKTNNNHTFYYVLNNIRTTSPDDDSVFAVYKGSPILTIQTCTGIFFQNRQFFTFNLEHAS